MQQQQSMSRPQASTAGSPAGPAAVSTAASSAASAAASLTTGQSVLFAVLLTVVTELCRLCRNKAVLVMLKAGIYNETLLRMAECGRRSGCKH